VRGTRRAGDGTRQRQWAGAQQGTERATVHCGGREKRYGYRIAVLLGVSPGSLDAELAAVRQAMTAPLPIRRPSRACCGRVPTLRIAERNLAAHGESRRRTTIYLPRVSFTGLSIGCLYGEPSNWEGREQCLVDQPGGELAGARLRSVHARWCRNGERPRRSVGLSEGRLHGLGRFRGACVG